MYNCICMYMYIYLSHSYSTLQATCTCIVIELVLAKFLCTLIPVDSCHHYIDFWAAWHMYSTCMSNIRMYTYVYTTLYMYMYIHIYSYIYYNWAYSALMVMHFSASTYMYKVYIMHIRTLPVISLFQCIIYKLVCTCTYSVYTLSQASDELSLDF